MYTRREFLNLGLAFAPLMKTPSLMLSGRPSPLAITGNREFFVLIRIFLGMDATLGLDPWTQAQLPDPKDMFVEYRPEDVVSGGGEIKLGPSAAVMAKHAGQFSVVNGVFMSQVDNGHPASQSYISAGSTGSGAPVLPVELAYASQSGEFGVLTNSTLDMGTRVVTTSNLSDLENIGSKLDLTDLLTALFGKSNVKTPYLDSVNRVIDSRASVQTFLNNLNAFKSKGAVKDMHVMAAAFLTEVAFYAQADLTGFNLDTHAAHPDNHKREQGKAWAAVDEMFSFFKSVPYGQGSLFDQTTFLVVTEFSRTPALNSANGKDHNPLTNSALFAGRGIQGGRVVGASRLITASESPTGSSYHIAYPIDFGTGLVQYKRTPSAQMMFPEHVAQTSATLMGVDHNLFQSVSPDTPVLSRLLKG